MHLVSFVCLRAWTGPAGKGAGFGSTKGGGGVPPPPSEGGGVPPPPPYSPPNCRTPLGVTHWLAPAPVLCLPQICAVHRQPPTWRPPTATIAIKIGIGDHGSSVFNTPASPNGTPTRPNGLLTFSVGRQEYRKIGGGSGLVSDPTRTKKTEKLRRELALREVVTTLHLCFVDGLCLRA